MRQEFSSISKVSSPALSGIFPRRRLFDILSSAHDRQAIWVSGPAGSGKTTLVASYLDDRKLPCLWYQADTDDGDISTFFYYLGLAAKRAAPRYRKPLPLLTPEYLLAIPTFTRRYFENLYARVRPPFAVVIDNYQEVPDDSPFHDVIREAISFMPTGITFFLISRGDPPRSLARLRANSNLLAIDWNKLRLTLNESGEIVKKRGRGALPKKLLAQFHARTGGWAAGLVLMTEVLKTRGIDAQGQGAAAPQEIFDYFAGEVLDKLDGATREFLLMTSLLPTMTEETARKLTGQDNAGRILSTLNRKHLFTEKHSNAHSAYQYHPLFREFLLARVKKTLVPDGVLHLQSRAAAILEEAGQIEDAAVLYRDAKNWERFIPLVLGYAHALIIQGRGRTLQGWIKSLPQPFLEQVPWLPYWLGICLLPLSPEMARNHLETAFTSFKARKDAAGSFLSLSGLFDLVALNFGNFAEYDRLISILYELRKEFPEYPSPEIEARIVAAMLYAIYTRQPHHPDFEYWMSRGDAVAKSISDPEGRARIRLTQALIRLYTGELDKTALLLEPYSEPTMTRNISPTSLFILKDAEVNYHWLAADFDKCLKATDDGIAFADASGIHIFDLFILWNGAAGALSAGEVKRAGDLLKKMKSYLDGRAMSWGENLYHDVIAWKCLLQGDFTRASLHADLAVKFGVESGAVITAPYHYLIKAMVAHESRREDEASAYLFEVRKICGTLKAYQTEFGYLLVEARFAFDRGEEAAGLEYLGKAMSLGKKHGYANTFFWLPEAMAKLCMRALDAGIEVEYVQSLVRRRNLVPDNPPHTCENWPWRVRVFTLGRFGIERDGKVVRFSSKVPKKPLEMLKVLVALGGQAVSETRLNDILWPDADGDSAHRAFNITVIRLRELIGPKEAVELRDGCVTLDKRYVWVDAWALGHLLGSASATQGGASLAPELLDRILHLYKGPFLAEENGSWAISLRERLKGRVENQLEKLGAQWEEEREPAKAIDCYRRGLEIDDLAEELYRRAILCYLKLGRRAEALSLYRRCEKISGSYGIKLSPETETIFKSLISG